MIETDGITEGYHWTRIDRQTIFEFDEEPSQPKGMPTIYPDDLDPFDYEEPYDRSKVDITFDPDAECDRYVESSFTSDGTLLFLYECAVRCLDKMVDDPKAHYVVKGISHMSEYDEDGTKFTPKDKPWCRLKTTVYVPFKKMEE